MAGQSIPRFDLYAALGVDPSADDAAIEAAYWDLFGQYGGDAEASDDRRIVRARLAREWLTDPDRRSRYDASRARAAARAAAKAAGTGAAAGAAADIAADEALDDEIAEDTIPWPAVDLSREAAIERQAAIDRHAAELEQSESNIAWSATPAAATVSGAAVQRAGRPQRRQLRYVGWGAVIVAGVAAAILLFSNFGLGDVAVRESASAPVQTTAPTTAPTVEPTLEPTLLPTSPPATQASGIDTAALQASSWQVLQSVITAASAGDVATAQSFLGDSAPGLRASGLRRATFPAVTAEQMTITQDATGYVAMADEVTRLTSADGQTWTLDYGNRPLAAYRTAGSAHDLWWQESDGKHHILLTATSATISKQSVSIHLSWTFDPADPSAFPAAGVMISSVDWGDGLETVFADSIVPMAGITSVTVVAGHENPPVVADELSIGVTIVNPRSAGGADRAVETVFVMPVR